MIRKKKTSLALKQQVQDLPIAATPSLNISLLDNWAGLLKDFGFIQVSSPALSENQNIFNLYAQTTTTREPYVAKWFYVSPNEIGVFILGDDSSFASAHLINTLTQTVAELGIGEFVWEISSRGCENCQKEYKNILQEHLGGSSNLCLDCLDNLNHNAVAVFDCQNESCRMVLSDNIPQVIDFLDDACRSSLVEVLETIDELEISYVLNPHLSGAGLREKILFRLTTPNLDNQNIGQGGNYSRLASLPAIGFLTTLENLNEFIPLKKPLGRIEVFIISLGAVAYRKSLILGRELHRAGIKIGEAMLGNQGIKNQLKQAAESHSEIALITGQREALDDTVILRDMRSSMQEIFTTERIIEEVKKRLAR